MWEILRSPIHQTWKTYWYQIHPSEIAELSWEYLFSGGKEIRARLFCELWTYLSPDTTPCGELAFAIECIHAASLILDDTPWMDNATTRRGRQTLHLSLSNKKALLICHDVMYMVYLIWNKNKPEHISASDWEHFILHHLQRLMVGQAYDLEKRGTLIELASMKTGVLFEFVAGTVALCTHLDIHAWRLWGNHVGILFQWMDDWHDREEDMIQHNRNAFNEAHTVTLSNYGQIWQKIKHVIGPVWFHRPFGSFMKKYFTNDIPLPDSGSTLLPSLSHLFLSYPTPILLSLPEINANEKHDLSSIICNPDRIIRINRRLIFDLERVDIEQLLRSKQSIEITINDRIDFQIDVDDLFHLEVMEWIQSFNKSNSITINGKQIIQIMLRVVKQLEQMPKNEMEPYRIMYESWKQKIWGVEETEWEYQPELIDFMYYQIQSMKHTRGY